MLFQSCFLIDSCQGTHYIILLEERSKLTFILHQRKKPGEALGQQQLHVHEMAKAGKMSADTKPRGTIRESNGPAVFPKRSEKSNFFYQ